VTPLGVIPAKAGIQALHLVAKQWEHVMAGTSPAMTLKFNALFFMPR
jgi:hypothetical protein